MRDVVALEQLRVIRSDVVQRNSKLCGQKFLRASYQDFSSSFFDCPLTFPFFKQPARGKEIDVGERRQLFVLDADFYSGRG